MYTKKWTSMIGTRKNGSTGQPTKRVWLVISMHNHLFAHSQSQPPGCHGNICNHTQMGYQSKKKKNYELHSPVYYLKKLKTYAQTSIQTPNILRRKWKKKQFYCNYKWNKIAHERESDKKESHEWILNIMIIYQQQKHENLYPTEH